jgi:hypothetical protein
MASGGRVKTHNNELYVKCWWEIYNKSKKWVPYANGGEYRKWYGNHIDIVNWSNEAIKYYDSHGGLCKEKFWFKEGLTWGAITSSANSYRIKTDKFMFSSASPTIFKQDYKCDKSVLAFLNSKVANFLSNIINPTLNQNVNDTLRLPYCGGSDQIEQLTSNAILISQNDWDSFETSWDFQHHPLIPTQQMKSEWQESQFADSRREKLGSLQWNYERWENECNDRFNQLKANEEELNRIFIDIYGLQDELTPEVEDKDVTVRKVDLGREIRSFISYAVGCMFGRYSLDREGLVYAGGDWNEIFSCYGGTFADTTNILMDGSYTFGELGSKFYYIPVEGKKSLDCWKVDVDNIIPITDEEYFSDDIVSCFVEFVKTVYGEASLEENLDFIASALGNKGDTSREVIRNYFLKDFYADHLKIYQKRPIYWLFDSGKQNGFKALIYMHRYDADTVGRVRTDYLHRAQKYVETAMQSAQYTIESTSSASDKSKATKAVAKYTKQLAEMQLYDEAIAHIANRRIEIDLDDGVKVNYAKFQGVEVAQEGKKTVKIDLLGKI